MSRGAYYNEIEPYAAQWLRNLIAAGHIAPGDVDERSIVDVRADDLRGYRQCHFFAGIGVWSYALRLAGWPDDREVWTGSCPCQPFSAAGKRGGTSDERHLWPTFGKLIAERRPSVVFGEQVASKDGLAWLDIVSADLEAAGYAIGAVDTCAAGFGAPHIRQRLYFAGHPESGERRLSKRSWQPEQTEWAKGEDRGRGTTSELADHQAGRRSEVDPLARGRDERVRAQRSERPDGGGEFGNLGHVDDAGSQGRRLLEATGSRNGSGERAARSAGATSGCLGDASSVGRERRQGPEEGCKHDGAPAGRQQSDDGSVGASEARSFWSACDWLACIDGKARPVESGTFPLAHGAPARVGRLRAYGNAINARQAAHFVRAYLEEEGAP